MRRTRKFWIIVTLLYAVTWIGGWISHQRTLSIHAQQLYEQAAVFEQEVADSYQQEGTYQPRRITREGGPIAEVNWCFPILPGVLIADSYYVVGPRNGLGGVSIVAFYGFGSFQFGPIWGWIS